MENMVKAKKKNMGVYSQRPKSEYNFDQNFHKTQTNNHVL